MNNKCKTKNIKIYYFINSQNWDDTQLNKIIDWYLNKGRKELINYNTEYEVSVDVLGQGSTSRAYILNPNDLENRRILKEFFPKIDSRYLIGNNGCCNISDKEVLEKLLIQFAESALNSQVYKTSEGLQILDCGLCFTSIGLCQISPYIKGERFDYFIGKEENIINSKEKFAKAIYYMYKILSDLSAYHNSLMLNGDIKANNMWYLKVDDMIKDGSGKPLTDTVRCLDFGSIIYIPKLIEQIKDEIQKNSHYSTLDIAKDLLVLFDSTRENYSEEVILKKLSKCIELIKSNIDDEIVELFSLLQELDVVAVIKLLYFWVFGIEKLSEKELMIKLCDNLNLQDCVGFETYHLIYLIKEFFNLIKIKEEITDVDDKIIDILKVNADLERIRKIIEDKDCYIDNHNNLREWNSLLEQFNYKTMGDFIVYVKREFKNFPHPSEIIEHLMYE